ncbi:BamA/TamA family outer membrane protein [Calditrichota bacterium]
MLSLSIATVLAICSDANTANFGKNTVQYTYFDWKYLTTEHFDIYYNQGGRGIADFGAEIAEDAYRDIAASFNYTTVGDEPITLITYQSHNDFEQTNVSSHPDESTGGLTEFLKSRMVLPYQGNHEDFRHVIHHELTHAMMLNLLYGKGFGAIVSGISRTRVPLWFTEGLAEYQSRGGLDPETEMYLRDAVVNDILPNMYQLESYGYLGVYKCGQSIVYWIAWRYGDQKIGEIMHNIKRMHDFDRALKVSIGIDREELFKRWRRFVKERYWTQVAKMDPPDRMAKQLTFHKKEYTYVNNSPALSPNGEWLAFLSNRSDYFDIYLMNTLDGKVTKRLVHGQRSGQFEELHWLRPGISWSPDGKSIALCAKAGELDALYIIDVESGDIKKSFKYEVDALFSPAWSPDGEQIALISVRDGQSDLSLINPKSGEINYLTDDIYDDADPSWSPNSRSLAFVSNRHDRWGIEQDISPRELADFPYSEHDVYLLDLYKKEIKRVTDDPSIENGPVWSDNDDIIIYATDKSGVSNFWAHNLSTDESWPLTNIVTGVSQPSYARNTNTLAFTVYFDHGFDIFTIQDPVGNKTEIELAQIPPVDKIPTLKFGGREKRIAGENLEHFVFDRLYGSTDKKKKKNEKQKDENLVTRKRTESGKYPVEDYTVKLEPDLVYLTASYDPYYYTQGEGQIVFSDVLGNHNLFVSANLNRAVKYSNLFFMYKYLPRRIDYAWGVYHHANAFYTSNDIWLDRNWGAFTNSSFPLNRFSRIEIGADFSTVERSLLATNLDPDKPTKTIWGVFPHLGYVHDTSIWGTSVEPTNGNRWRVDAQFSPLLSGSTDSENSSVSGVDFQTYTADWRRYLVFHRDYSFSFRATGGLSNGKTPQRFFLGGMTNWFNRRFDNVDNEVQIDLHDVYFSRFITPLRGVGYYNQTGTRYALTNVEFRFPFIRYLLLGWPLPAYFQNVRGALFYDLGTAWSTNNLTQAEEDQLIKSLQIPKPREWSNGLGIGIRLDLGIFPIEWDVAWSPITGMVPQYYFSLNLGF